MPHKTHPRVRASRHARHAAAHQRRLHQVRVHRAVGEAELEAVVVGN